MPVVPPGGSKAHPGSGLSRGPTIRSGEREKMTLVPRALETEFLLADARLVGDFVIGECLVLDEPLLRLCIGLRLGRVVGGIEDPAFA